MPITIKTTSSPHKKYRISEIDVGFYFHINGSLYYMLSDTTFISFEDDILEHPVHGSRDDECAIKISPNLVDIQITYSLAV